MSEYMSHVIVTLSEEPVRSVILRICSLFFEYLNCHVIDPLNLTIGSPLSPLVLRSLSPLSSLISSPPPSPLSSSSPSHSPLSPSLSLSSLLPNAHRVYLIDGSFRTFSSKGLDRVTAADVCAFMCRVLKVPESGAPGFLWIGNCTQSPSDWNVCPPLPHKVLSLSLSQLFQSFLSTHSTHSHSFDFIQLLQSDEYEWIQRQAPVEVHQDGEENLSLFLSHTHTTSTVLSKCSLKRRP